MLEIKHLSKVYKSKQNEVRALDDISLKLQDKGMVFILGKSGSGKSTLLNVLGGLDSFDQGEILIGGKSSKEFSQSDFDSYRNTFIGFIFQEYNVMENFSVKENIALALQLQGKKADTKSINAILEEVDLQNLGDRKPNELSGGQLQRVAIARALIKQPEIIMADEPTGALDSRTGRQVFDTLKKLSKDKLVLIVSHDKEFAKQYADRIIELADGKIIADTSKELIAPKQAKNGVSFFDKEFIDIKNTQDLTEEDLKIILTEIKKHQGEAMISFHSETNKEIKKANHIADDGKIEVFHDTKEEQLHIEEKARGISFIKSRLPFKSSLRLATSNLKLKPFRLFMTILLSVVSFSLFGLTNTMSQYQKETATFNSMKDSGINYVSIGKNAVIHGDGYSYENFSKLNSEDIDRIIEKYSEESFIRTFSNYNYGTNLDFSGEVEKVDELYESNQSNFYATNFSALAELSMDVIQENGFSFIGNLPKNENEIVVTEFVAQTWKDYGFQEMGKDGEFHKVPIITSQDLIGHKLSLMVNGKTETFTISGILDTKLDTSRYNILRDENHQESFQDYYLQNELASLLTESYHSIGFVDNTRLLDCIRGYNVYSLNGNSTVDIAYEDMYYSPMYFYHINDVDKEDIVDFKNDGNIYVNYMIIKDLKIENGMTLEQYISQQLANTTSKEEQKEVVKDAVKEYQSEIMKANYQFHNYMISDTAMTDEKIAGVYVSDVFESEEQVLVLTDEIIKEYGFEKDGYANFIIAPMMSDELLHDVISYTYDDGIAESNYVLKNQVMPMLTSVTSVVETLEPVLFVLGIGFAVFAAVMFCNFIATSIANKKREIGILRAVGARGLDVLKIFLNESMVIALINWIVSVIACYAETVFINSYLRDEFGILVTVLNFGALQVVLLLVIAVVVAILASAFPVYRISHKKPIDAIKNRK